MTTPIRQGSPTTEEAVAAAVSKMQVSVARAKSPEARAKTPVRPSAPGAKRDAACALPQLWKEDPRLTDVQGMLEDVMTRIHDWGDLFDMVRARGLGLLMLRCVADWSEPVAASTLDLTHTQNRA
jgi:hypothetical protein